MPGMTGVSSTPTSRMASAESNKTCARRSADAGSFAQRPRGRRGDEFVGGVHQPAHRGHCLVRSERVHRVSILLSDLLSQPARAGRRPTREGVRRPWQYRWAIAVTRLTRLPRLLREIDVVSLFVPLPREVAVTAEGHLFGDVEPERIRPETRTPPRTDRRRCRASCSSADPFNVMKPWPKTARGSATPALISMAGQMTAWKRVMSLPMTCRSAGHHRSNIARSLPRPTAEA